MCFLDDSLTARDERVLIRQRLDRGYHVGGARAALKKKECMDSLCSVPIMRCYSTEAPPSKSLPTQSQATGPLESKKDEAGVRSIARDLKIYGELGKKQLSMLVVASAGGGFLLAGSPFSVPSFCALLAGTTLCAFSANTFNQIYEHKTDKLMKRTRLRPLPSGRITMSRAVNFAVSSGVSGTLLLACCCHNGPLVGLLGLGNIILYSGVYTPMKQWTSLNTWVGAVVGAIPPLMGYAASSQLATLVDSNTSAIFAGFPVDAWLLSSGLLLWQFPHFFALAFMNKADYAAGGHHMVPVFDPSGTKTANYISQYSLLLSTVPFLAYYFDIVSIMFPIESLFFNGYFLLLAERFRKERTRQNARKVFLASLWYLPLFMALFIFHKKHLIDNRASTPVVDFGVDISLPLRATDWPEAGVVLERRLKQLKDMGKAMCIHECFVKKNADSTTSFQRQATERKASTEGDPVEREYVPAEEKELKPFCISTK